jgi:hypothetical protein
MSGENFKNNTSEALQNFASVRLFIKFAWILILMPLLLIGSCNRPPSGTAYDELDNEKFEIERERIAKERKQEQEDLEREVIARNLPSETKSETIWKQFRQTYPYHSQTLALSKAESDGSRTLIVSEPPPHLTLGNILSSVSGVLLNHSIQKQVIGYDGWVKDIVIAVNGNEREIASAISSLNLTLFQTSYKAYILPLPAQCPVQTNHNLDLRVTANELKAWIIGAQESFTPVEGGKSTSAFDIFKQNYCAVFAADNAGIIAWWIPKGKAVSDCKAQARQFTLDSDLLIGAISKNDGILILGRERITPVDVLPPLRVETLELLASVQQGQNGKLAQSYERKFE